MIRLLPPSLQNQIAAGEVVERPASVVKELVENSIDAGSTNIIVQIEEGGLKEIRIIDNGCGMNPDDAVMSFQRYATSKIATTDDLFTLSSFGFRGEAIAAIASVSHCTIRTKQANDLHGIEVKNGDQSTPIGCAVGTETIVENLFWNVPARKKFMKSAETETREIVKTIEQFALSHPLVSFTLRTEHREILSFPLIPSDYPFLIRCKKVLGENIASYLLPLQYDGNDMRIEGFCSHSSLHRSTKDKQFFFVNGRMIQRDSIFSACIQQAYQSLLPSGKHPVVVLSLTIPPDQVDVNVHPRKLEVKFSHPKEIFQIIKGSLEKGLSRTSASLGNSVVPKAVSPAYHLPHVQKSTTFSNDSFPRVDHVPLKPISTRIPFFSMEEPHLESHSWKVIGQVRNSFIVVEESNGIRIIDQHAAHERVRYEQYQKALAQKTISSQLLLTPVVMSFSTSEKLQLLDNLPELEAFGFSIEDFGGNEVAVTAVPSGSEHIELEKLFSALLADLDFFDPAFGKALQGIGQRIISYAACRGAKKFGDRLSQSEMEALVEDWKQCDTPDACAHGRKVSSFFLFQEIENECGRY